MNTPGHLRALRAVDAPDVLAAFLSAPDMSRQGQVTTLSEAEAFVGRLISPTGDHCAVAVTEDDRLIGLVVVTVDRANRSGWVSYWMNASHRGRGWMARAVATVADRALGDEGLERLELGHRANNPASGRVATAAGFVVEGVERSKFLIDGERADVICYGRLPTDAWPLTSHLPWQPS